MSRKKIVILVVLAVAPLALVTLAMPLLPDTVALHFGSNGVDDWSDKTMLFLPAGVMAVLELFVTWIMWATMRPKDPNNPNQIVLDPGMGITTLPYWPTVILFAVLDCIIAGQIAFNLFFIEGATELPSTGSTVPIALIVILMAVFWTLAGLCFAGKGTRLLNFHPGTSDRERDLDTDRSQSRAIGFLMLFLSFVVLAMLLAPSLMQG